MTTPRSATRDWGATLFLPQTPFPMRAGLPQLEPKLLERWAKLGLYHRLRAAAKGRPKFILHDGPPYANANIHYGHRAQQDPQGRGDALPADAGLRFQLRAGLGLPRPAHRVEDRGAVPRQGPGQGQRARQRIPPAVPRVRPALDRRADGGVQAPRRRGRLGALLLHHGLSGRGHHRLRADEVRPQRRPVPRLQARDVERGGEDRAGRGRGRVPRLHQRYGLGEVSCQDGGSGNRRRGHCAWASST